MSQASHRAFLENSARRAAVRAALRNGHAVPTVEDLRGLRIQTVEPWKRIVVALVGLFFLAVTVHGIRDDFNWVALLFFGGLSLVCLLIAIFGCRRSIQEVVGGALEFTLRLAFEAAK